jgi:tripartite-type tricarboxylate transporter receptor subunit TctC
VLTKLASFAVLFLAFGAPGASAQSYPSKPVTIVVPAAAGGPSDTVARVLAPALATELKGTVLIENQGGAGGTIGAGPSRAHLGTATRCTCITSRIPRGRRFTASSRSM